MLHWKARLITFSGTEIHYMLYFPYLFFIKLKVD